MSKVKTNISDIKDTSKKVSKVREMAATDSSFAVMAARKIVEHPSLLQGLGKVVEQLAQHEEAARMLESLFEKEKWVVKAYPNVYRAFLKARFFGR
jgi:tRNA-dihydrouridine synthase